MADDWQAGDIAECIDVSPPERIGYWVEGEAPVLKALYNVEGVEFCTDPDTGACFPILFFQEIKRDLAVVALILHDYPDLTPEDVGDPGYDAKRFRKVLRPDPEFLTRLMADALDLPLDPQDYPRPKPRVKEKA